MGHGFGYGLVTPDMVSRTLSARYHKDGSSSPRTAIGREGSPRANARG